MPVFQTRVRLLLGRPLHRPHQVRTAEVSPDACNSTLLYTVLHFRWIKAMTKLLRGPTEAPSTTNSMKRKYPHTASPFIHTLLRDHHPIHPPKVSPSPCL
ncbi:hypothetical protein SCLCIDRAFT_923368 [Scleroderma citrinum Foug A]|uniref:Uncharacterized protein n=1 Tax=Scleroderma citrinum Foug A TaxID=1036808 RepID=A0A0C3DYA0_9AGAM|nr:hypothetical protein SCLCIDRAFT_923368 [Scleroderma citrinum Foug A]